MDIRSMSVSLGTVNDYHHGSIPTALTGSFVTWTFAAVSNTTHRSTHLSTALTRRVRTQSSRNLHSEHECLHNVVFSQNVLCVGSAKWVTDMLC